MATRIVYSDLDGTMVGPGGSFFRAADGASTLEPARALVELHNAGVTLVLVSGRTAAQLVEACRIFGADGFVGELGAVIGWDRGRRVEVLRGALPAGLDGPPIRAIEATGVVDELFARHRGRLGYHAPWHEDHQADVMLRGRIDVSATQAWLAAQGLDWLRLHDNGELPRTGGEHVYHLMPDRLSKGLGVTRDLGRRGLPPADAVAVGDSASDLDMAAHVGRMWLVANGASALAAHPTANVRLAEGAVGLGWAQAVRAALAGR